MADRNGPIQVQPAGLLGLLQIKNVGRSPSDLSLMIAPVLEQEGYYLRGLQELIPNALNVQVSASEPHGVVDTTLQVGPQEWWYVHALTMSANAVNVGAMTARIVGRLAGQSADALIAAESYSTAAAPFSFRLTLKDFWAPPGYQFGWEILPPGGPAWPWHLWCSGRITRLQV